MKLSASNIGWEAEHDEEIYRFLRENEFSGIEIAPTRILQEKPYDRLEEAEKWYRSINEKYGLFVSSMQSIWYGRQENIFHSEEEYDSLLKYTKKAIDFAKAVNCKNLVFGCPRNRTIPETMEYEEAEAIAIRFFKELGDYAYQNSTVLAMEPNPPIYNTNFLNDTGSAIHFVQKVNSKGLLLNLDMGTMICNGESADLISGHVKYINHVHMSEPGLKIIEKRELHTDVLSLLEKEYQGYVSIEMAKQKGVNQLKDAVIYLADLYRNVKTR